MSHRISRQPWRSEAGMTLLEIMFAAAIMASTLVFMLGSIVTLSMTSDISGDQAAVMAQITGIVEELRNLSEADLLYYVPPEPPPGSPEQTVQISYTLHGGDSFIAPWIPDAPDVDDSGAEQPAAAAPALPNPLYVQITVAGLSKTGRHFVIQSATVVGR
jgi:type II secretory pathway pseudopilin PulG